MSTTENKEQITADSIAKSTKEMRAWLENEIIIVEHLIRLTHEQEIFPLDLTVDMESTILVVKQRMHVAGLDELCALVRLMKYEQTIVGGRIATFDAANIMIGGNTAGQKMSKPEASLLDLDESIKLLNGQIEAGILDHENVGSIIRDLSLAAEKLRFAIETKNEKEIALEEEYTRNLVNGLINKIKSAIINPEKGDKFLV